MYSDFHKLVQDLFSELPTLSIVRRIEQVKIMTYSLHIHIYDFLYLRLS